MGFGSFSLLGSSGDQQSTLATTNISTVETNSTNAASGSLVAGKGGVVNVIDSNAVEKAFAFSQAAFDKAISTVSGGFGEAMSQVTTIGKNATTEVQSAYMAATGKDNPVNVNKLALYAAVVLAVGMAVYKFRGSK